MQPEDQVLRADQTVERRHTGLCPELPTPPIALAAQSDSDAPLAATDIWLAEVEGDVFRFLTARELFYTIIELVAINGAAGEKVAVLFAVQVQFSQNR